MRLFITFPLSLGQPLQGKFNLNLVCHFSAFVYFRSLFVYFPMSTSVRFSLSTVVYLICGHVIGYAPNHVTRDVAVRGYIKRAVACILALSDGLGIVLKGRKKSSRAIMI